MPNLKSYQATLNIGF